MLTSELLLNRQDCLFSWVVTCWNVEKRECVCSQEREHVFLSSTYKCSWIKLTSYLKEKILPILYFCCWKVTEWTCPHTVCAVKLYNKVSGTMHITCSTSKDWYLSFFATCWWGLNENTDNYTRFSNCGFFYSPTCSGASALPLHCCTARHKPIQ